MRRGDGIGGGGGGLAGREREGSEGEAAGRERFGEGRDGGGTRGGRVGHGAEEARVAEHGMGQRKREWRSTEGRCVASKQEEIGLGLISLADQGRQKGKSSTA